MTVRRGLGRGLGALIPAAPPSVESGREDSREPLPADGASMPVTDPPTVRRALSFEPAAAEGAASPGAYFAELEIDKVRPNPRQPRGSFDEDALQELAESLALVGLLQPVVVRPTSDGDFELVMGERRWRAAQRAGLASLPAIVRRTSDADLLRDALLENLHRADLNPLEEAAAYQQLLEDFDVTQEELALRIGRSRPHISNTIRLLRLPPTVQRRVAAGVLSAGHARALLAVDDAAAQEQLAARAVAEGLSVRALEELVMAPDGGRSSRRLRASSVHSPELSEIGAVLSERFETRCSVDLGRRKGKITIEFATLQDLQRILQTMEEGAGGLAHHSVAVDT